MNPLLSVFHIIVFISGLALTIALYLGSLVIYPWRKLLLKQYVRLILRLLLWTSGIQINMTIPDHIPTKGCLFVANNSVINIHMLLYALLPPRSFSFWSSSTLPPPFFFLLRPFMVLPLDQFNLARQQKQLANIASKKKDYAFSSLLNDNFHRELSRDHCSTGAAYMAIANQLTVIPVSLFMDSSDKKLIINVKWEHAIPTDAYDQSKPDRSRLTDVIYNQIVNP